MSDSLRPHRLYSPWSSLSQYTRVGSLSFLQGIFPTEGLNPGLLHCRWILSQLNHKGSPRILEWVAYPFSSASSWPRNRTVVSSIAGRFFYQLSYQRSPQSESEGRSVVSNSLWLHGLYSPWNSPGQNTGVGRLSLLQWIFPTQGSNPGLLNCKWILYQLSHKRKPRNTGVGSLSLLQCIFLTQESNQGLLHCRQILYQLNYQGSHSTVKHDAKGHTF